MRGGVGFKTSFSLYPYALSLIFSHKYTLFLALQHWRKGFHWRFWVFFFAFFSFLLSFFIFLYQVFLFVYTNCTNLNLNNNTQPLSSHVLQTRVLRWRKMLSKQNLNNNIGVFTLLNLGRSVTLGKSALAPVSSLRARHCSVNLTGQVQHVPVRWCIHLKIIIFFTHTDALVVVKY